MSTILKKYDLSFTIYKNSRNQREASMSSKKDALLSYHLWGYFLNQSTGFLVEDVLPEIDKAMSMQPFDSDAGGTLSFLTIGQSTSSLSGIDEAKADVLIPTQDIKDIIIAWTQWLINNDLQTDITL